MLEHPGFRKLAFTGSSEVGCQVGCAASEKLIPSTLELGGKSANIFFPDCKWDMAMDGLQLGILFNQGQVCCAGSRVFVHEDIYDRFVEEAVAKFNSVKAVSYTHLGRNAAGICKPAYCPDSSWA